MERYRESDLEVELIRVLSESGIACVAQVPLFTRTVDVVGELNCGAIFAVECKLHDWQRAVAQAAAHRNTFDFVYVCLPEREYPDRFIELARSQGIGVLTMSMEHSRLMERLPARKNEARWEPNADRMREAIKNQRGEL
jgi:hypothetical protein